MKPISSISRAIQPSAGVLLLAGFCLTAACSRSEDPGSHTKEAWDRSNDPSLFSLEIMKLEDLPERGMLPEEKFPWSDSYWPTYAGGISQRWQLSRGGTDYRDFLYRPLDAQDLMNGGRSIDIAKLSPAEKFDLYQNRYDFPLTQFEQRRTQAAVNSRGEVPTWFGLCHGWAVASLLEQQPGPVAVVTNQDGLEIPFYTSDIGALLTHVYAFSTTPGRYMGTRCNVAAHDIDYDENDRVVMRQCRDLNPGSLHLALTQMLGLPESEDRQPFTLDVTATDEVWNYPVVGYEVESLEVEDYDRDDDDLAEYRADGTAQLAHVDMKVYVVGGAAPHARPVSPQRFIKTETYAYTLELDEDGRIIGGEWNSRERPDFMWMIYRKPSGTALLPHAEVAKLLEISRGEATP